jgi:hypothetical protein
VTGLDTDLGVTLECPEPGTGLPSAVDPPVASYAPDRAEDAVGAVARDVAELVPAILPGELPTGTGTEADTETQTGTDDAASVSSSSPSGVLDATSLATDAADGLSGLTDPLTGTLP